MLAELRLAYRRVTLHRQAITEALNMVEKGVDPELALQAMRDSLDYVIPGSEEGNDGLERA